MPSGELEGKVAWITGGASGIGLAGAIELKKLGATVVVSGRNEATLKKAGFEGVLCDVADKAQVAKAAAEVTKRHGRIDLLVASAGINLPKRNFRDVTLEGWDEIVAVNLSGVFYCVQAVLPGMRARRWGRIINLTSVAGQTGSVFGLHYSAAKAGMIGLTRSYARLLVKEGITVNAISPALIATEMVTANPTIKPDLIPMGRFGELSEVADVAVMLAGNGFITGQTLGVNGGLYLG